MAKRQDQIKLSAFLMHTGHHIAAWRHPDATVGMTLADYAAMAKLAEEAKFDAMFLADSPALGMREASSRTAHNGLSYFEPVTLLSAIAAQTKHIGLIGTASTSFTDPYTLARQFSSLDHLSDGRAGWNVVTTSNQEAAMNFSFEGPLKHEERYERAAEFTEVVFGLWDSFDDDAVVKDRESGRYFDPNKVHVLGHKGKYFKVRGPLNTPRPPQGRPVVLQAGSSGTGQDLAARFADVVFASQNTLEQSVQYYADVKGRLAKYNRTADEMKIMLGIFPVVGRTQQEAEDKFEQLQTLIEPVVGLSILSYAVGAFDLSKYDLDGPVPDIVPQTNASKGQQAMILELARKENLTIRQLYLRIAGARGHWQVVGTPTQIADMLEERFESYGADGFQVLGPIMPGGLVDFIEMVVPELRRRGLFRTEYEGRTFRENLGLARPESRYAVEWQSRRDGMS